MFRELQEVRYLDLSDSKTQPAGFVAFQIRAYNLMRITPGQTGAGTQDLLAVALQALAA